MPICNWYLKKVFMLLCRGSVAAQISLAKSLSTCAELLISNSSEGCQIDVTVSVSASVPWPMTSTIEALMADQVNGSSSSSSSSSGGGGSGQQQWAARADACSNRLHQVSYMQQQLVDHAASLVLGMMSFLKLRCQQQCDADVRQLFKHSLHQYYWSSRLCRVLCRGQLFSEQKCSVLYLLQAKKTVGQYVEYISKYVEGVLQQMNNEAAMQQQLQQVQQQGGPCCALRELHLATS
jgi:hypothetical protein